MKVLLLFLIFILLILFTQKAYGHDEYRSSLLINNIYVVHNPIPSKSVENFDLTHEISLKNYLVLQKINFRTDPSKVVKPLEWIKKAKFSLDFGDGIKQDGIEATHVYQKIGTYTVSVYGQIDDNAPELISQVRLHVIPLKNYALPRPIIVVNALGSVQNKIEFKFNKEINLDGSSSVKGSAKITDYLWDLGDGTFSSQPKLKHKYDPRHFGAIVILRLKDENGFYTDSYVEIINNETTVSLPKKQNFFAENKATIAVGLSLFGVLFLIFVLTKARDIM